MKKIFALVLVLMLTLSAVALADTSSNTSPAEITIGATMTQGTNTNQASDNEMGFKIEWEDISVTGTYGAAYKWSVSEGKYVLKTNENGVDITWNTTDASSKKVTVTNLGEGGYTVSAAFAAATGTIIKNSNVTAAFDKNTLTSAVPTFDASNPTSGNIVTSKAECSLIFNLPEKCNTVAEASGISTIGTLTITVTSGYSSEEQQQA